MRRSNILLASLLGVMVLCNGARAEILTSQPGDFSGTQRKDGWTYGYYDRTADVDGGGNGIYDDSKFKRFRGGESGSPGPPNQWFFTAWLYEVTAAFPATEITRGTMNPNTFKGIEHYPVMRWTSTKKGIADITGFFRRENTTQGDGTIGRIFRNGTEIFAEKTFDEPAEIDVTVGNMARGDEFDFIVDFGSDWDGDDVADSTAYSFIFDLTGDGVIGDFNGNGVLDLPDIDDLTGQAAGGTNPSTYDLNSDSKVDTADINVWVKDLYKTWIGDSNLDGEFNTADLVGVLASGTYEVDVDSVWSTGDFNGDKRTDTNDLVGALADGGYEQGTLPAVSAIPEPSSLVLCLLGGLPLLRRVRRTEWRAGPR